MNITQQTLEILIGKYLDGEITPAEKDLLDAALQEDSQARELLEQLQQLNQNSRQVIASEMLESGKQADEIFEQAWQQAKHSKQRVVKIGSFLRFAAGVAAGLIIGLTLHFTILANSTPQGSFMSPDSPQLADVQSPSDLIFPAETEENVFRNVDWYSFTDESGDQWLIEGLRESIVRPAVYEEGL
jgi:anti-sigma factor RsiW